VSSDKSALNVKSDRLANIEAVSIVVLDEIISPILTSTNESCLYEGSSLKGVEK
jgi:DNA replication protein DnaC